MTIEMRHRVYVYGASILAVDGLAYLLAILRTPHIDPLEANFSSTSSEAVRSALSRFCF